MVIYLVVFVSLIALIKGYFMIADHYNIIDKPNERSSHSHLTIRGGGIIFPVATLIWFFIFGFNQPWIIVAMLIMAVVSFVDDVITLSSGVRILAHFVSVAILFWQLQVFGLPVLLIILAFFVAIGWINAFNFMDGINGITAFYSLVAVVTFAWVNNSLKFVPDQLIVVLAISLLIFSFFNARKVAVAFAGDVGSVTLAFLLLWFMVSLMMKTGRIEYILFFAIYGIDTVITILQRALKRENILKAHRTHLFQYLSNEKKLPQILVSGIYGCLQLIINVFTVAAIENSLMTWWLFVSVLMVLGMVYLLVKYRITKSIQVKQC
jgi:UDP-N-acetylmuramyl pentapeptide phosphotransferase/UDP-N-acetylglucosamine-1-phosphate transferase